MGRLLRAFGSVPSHGIPVEQNRTNVSSLEGQWIVTPRKKSDECKSLSHPLQFPSNCREEVNYRTITTIRQWQASLTGCRGRLFENFIDSRSPGRDVRSRNSCPRAGVIGERLFLDRPAITKQPRIHVRVSFNSGVPASWQALDVDRPPENQFSASTGFVRVDSLSTKLRAARRAFVESVPASVVHASAEAYARSSHRPDEIPRRFIGLPVIIIMPFRWNHETPGKKGDEPDYLPMQPIQGYSNCDQIRAEIPFRRFRGTNEEVRVKRYEDGAGNHESFSPDWKRRTVEVSRNG